MEIKVIAGDIATLKTDAIIVNTFEEEEHLDGNTAVINELLAGTITQLIDQGEIKGKLNEVTIIHSLGKLPATHVVLTGLGKKKELSLDTRCGRPPENRQMPCSPGR